MDRTPGGSFPNKYSPFSQFCLNSLSPLQQSLQSPSQAMDLDSPFVSQQNHAQPFLQLFDNSQAIPAKTCVCKCRKTFCLKLYCDCFARGEYCGGCGCMECKNLPEFENERREAKTFVLDRNPEAFRRSEVQVPIVGCNCRRSGCLKKYCECYANGKSCNSSCRCDGCLNAKQM
ncbi:unnamed protein product [Blepharisma stoltei]|uniref:CRC domain-containing protein n=1 Tax=Blepharisma stoltei TaxID=1481888 RepID=A0AAU9IH39_9CILI|nr:unnamed protein product [Blepharisma stoltei]